MFTVAVRLPPLWMSLNGRAHFSKTGVVRDGLKQDAEFSARQAPGFDTLPRDAPFYRVEWLFVVPDNIRRDTTNMIAACKYVEDGISNALGVDDSRFVMGGAYVVVAPGRRYVIARMKPVEAGLPSEAFAFAQSYVPGLPLNVNALTKAMDGWGRGKGSLRVTAGTRRVRTIKPKP